MKHLIAFMMLGLVGFVVGFTCPGNTIYDKHYLNFPLYGGARAINSNYYCPGQSYIASYNGIVSTITFRLSRGHECSSNQTLLVDVWNSSRVLIATSEPTFSVGVCGSINFLFNVVYDQTQGQRYYFGVRPGTFDDQTMRMVQIDNYPTGWTQCQADMCHPNGPNPKEDCAHPFTYPFAISVCLPEAICSSPCQNGGVCVGSNTCQCPSEWTGSTCSTPVCSPSCENGGTCSAPNTCTCTAEWVGPTCNSAYACASDPCQNGGTCIGTNTCQCTSSWTGATCTTPVCSSSCENGGTCSAPNTCTCTNAWTGPTCSAPSLAKDYIYIHFPDWSSANVSNLQSTSWWPVVGTSDYTILASIVVQNKVGGLAAGMVITKDVDYQAANQLRIEYNYNSNRLEFYSNQGSGTSTVTATHDVMGPTLTFGTQYHVAAVRKGVSIKLYVSSGGDPAEYANGNPPNVIINNSASTAWTIGQRTSNTDLALAGQITNARIYGAALNVASLKQAWGI